MKRSDRVFYAAFSLSFATVYGHLDVSWWVPVMWYAIAGVFVAPFVLSILSDVYYRLFISKPPKEEFDSLDDAEVWFLTHGYEITHQCGGDGIDTPGHIVGEKNLLIPGVSIQQEVRMGPDELNRPETIEELFEGLE